MQRAKLSRPMTKTQFEVVVAQTLASHPMRAHADALGSRDGGRDSQRPHVPAACGVRRDAADGASQSDMPTTGRSAPGWNWSRSTARAVADLVKQFWAVNYADGDIETAKRHDIAQDFAKDYWWLVGQPEDFTVTAKDPESGRTVTAKLTGVTEAQRKANHNPVNDAMLAGLAKVRGESYEKLSLRFLKDPDIAEIRIPLFIGDDYPRLDRANLPHPARKRDAKRSSSICEATAAARTATASCWFLT